MVSEERGHLFRRKDGKYLIYLPKSLAEDSMFPFKDLSKSERGGSYFIDVKVSFKLGGAKRLVIKKGKRLRKLHSTANLIFLKASIKDAYMWFLPS
jgi:hypothetical protein